MRRTVLLRVYRSARPVPSTSSGRACNGRWRYLRCVGGFFVGRQFRVRAYGKGRVANSLSEPSLIGRIGNCKRRSRRRTQFGSNTLAAFFVQGGVGLPVSCFKSPFVPSRAVAS